ncbi:unnamed protein product [Citrullus colocynthis]|uniref:RING-type E3 ubiquitin transferase n=1 Tax=Citrullus colocynthis TaxID=252529 RepID=A0ABP0YJA1_9ROSI
MEVELKSKGAAHRSQFVDGLGQCLSRATTSITTHVPPTCLYPLHDDDPLSSFNLTVQAQPTSDVQYFKLSRPLTVAILLLLFIFFVILFFSLYIRHYLELNAASDAIIQAARRVDRFGACHGLDPAEIRAFPVVAHSAIKEMKMGKWWSECAVCLTEFQHYETLRLLPKCGHVFHPACIDAWLASCATCPICRGELAAGENCSSEFVAIDVVDRNGDDGRNGEVLDN